MAASIKQVVAFANNNGGVAPTVTITGVTAGNTLYLVVWSNSGLPGGGWTFSDGTNTWSTALDTQTSSYASQQFVAQNVAGGTFVIVAGQLSNYPICVVVEVQDVSNTCLDGHALSGQFAPGAGVGALTVGPPSPNNTSTPALVVTICADQYNAVDTVPTVAALGYTLFNTYSPGLGALIAVASAYLTTGESTAATFTAHTGVDDYVTSMAIFNETPPPATPVPYWAAP